MSGEVSLFDRIFPEDIPSFLHAVETSQEKMSTCRQEYRIVTAAGELRWVSSKSSPTEQEDGSTIWHGFLTDVTEQKRNQEALTRGKERLRNALDAMQACVWEYDLVTGELHLSPEWNALFGYESAGRGLVWILCYDAFIPMMSIGSSHGLTAYVEESFEARLSSGICEVMGFSPGCV